MSRKSSVVKLPKLTCEPTPNTSQGSRTDDRTAIAIRRLRSRLQSLRQHPVYGPRLDMSTTNLLKWLRVSGNDVFAADARIRRSLELREKMKLDSFMSNGKLPKIFRSGYPGGLCGTDREGSPVYYELCGLLELKDILKSAGKDNFFRYKFYQHEKILEFLKETGDQNGEVKDSMLVVVDLQFCQKDNLCPANLTIFSESLPGLLLVPNTCGDIDQTQEKNFQLAVECSTTLPVSSFHIKIVVKLT
ncbi:hypothetical protein Btru_047218 [Bulinus truncatus]|nr:hypothetical protein Btru_047218 [Bulinus truncatus]